MNAPDNPIDSFEETMAFDSTERHSDVPDRDSAQENPQEPAGHKVELLTGSANNLSDEINDLLATRLRLVSLLFFFGHLAFLVVSIISPAPGAKFSSLIFYSHAVLTAITGLVGSRSCVGQCMSSKKMRIAEILVFGGSTVFFFMVTLGRFINSAEQGFFSIMNGPWMLLIFTYALFMPNNWKRAAAVIIPMALCPVLAMAIAWGISEPFREVLRKPEFGNSFATTFMAMAFSASIAIHGVRTIRSLRTAAFEAKQLGQYRLTERIGAGGMGEVYRAEHMLLKRECAIKVIRPEKAGDRTVLQRFEREVQLTAQLTHWNTVEIYDYGHTDDGTFYYVMEYLHGMNLHQLVQDVGPLNECRVAHLLMQTCDALDEAHSVGMVHRDIKPANIFAAEIGKKYDVAKLLDFGLVTQLTGAPNNVELTQQNVIIGSPLYMSPEQAGGESVDARSDIYSLGAVAYYLLTGKPPFDGKNPIEIIVAHAKEPAPDLPSTVSPELAAIVHKCLAKDPKDRFQNVTELGAELQQCKSAWCWTDSKQWWDENAGRLAHSIEHGIESNSAESNSIGANTI